VVGDAAEGDVGEARAGLDRDAEAAAAAAVAGILDIGAVDGGEAAMDDAAVVEEFEADRDAGWSGRRPNRRPMIAAWAKVFGFDAFEPGRGGGP
jgi:hypothetical protein